MVAPTVSATTQRLWDRLPEVYREADALERTGGGYPLLRFLSLYGDQLDEVRVIFDRIDYNSLSEGVVGDRSQLLDPATADASWLPWMAQVYGVTLAPGLTVAEQRTALAAGASGWSAGSKNSILAAVRPVLSGERLVTIEPNDPFAAVADRPFSIVVHTRHSETGVLTWEGLESTYRDWSEIDAVGTWEGLNPRDVDTAIRRAGVLPAGVVMRTTLGVLTWERLAAAGVATWEDMAALGSTWEVLEDL